MTPAERQHPTERAPIGEAEIAEGFRGAVEASSPTFSATLHTEVMRGIRHRRAQDGASSPAPLRLHPWHIAALGAAAAVVLLAVAIALLLSSRSDQESIVKDPHPPHGTSPVASHSPLSLPRLTDAFVYVDPVKEHLDRKQRAFFTRSANRLQHYCLDQLRIFPSRPQRDRSQEPTEGTPAAG